MVRLNRTERKGEEREKEISEKKKNAQETRQERKRKELNAQQEKERKKAIIGKLIAKQL